MQQKATTNVNETKVLSKETKLELPCQTEEVLESTEGSDEAFSPQVAREAEPTRLD